MMDDTIRIPKMFRICRFMDPPYACTTLLQDYFVKAVAELLRKKQRLFIWTGQSMHRVKPSWQPAEFAELAQQFSAQVILIDFTDAADKNHLIRRRRNAQRPRQPSYFPLLLEVPVGVKHLHAAI